MTQEIDIQSLLYHARLLLEEGQSDMALSIFSVIQSDSKEVQNHITYLYSWYYMQSRQWEKAITTLAPFLQTDEAITPLPQIERELQAVILLHLGIAAAAMSLSDDAIDHFTHCLKLLHDRRVHLPQVRIQAHVWLGKMHLLRTSSTPAIQHFEEALRLCHHYQDEQALPDIYHGLSKAYRANGSLPQTYQYALEALRLYEQQANSVMVAQLHFLLGQISMRDKHVQDAITHLQTALELASIQHEDMLAVRVSVLLAELQLTEGHLMEARQYSQCALHTINVDISSSLCGLVYYTVGKISAVEAQQVEGEQRTLLLEEAHRCFAQADEQLKNGQDDIPEMHRSDLYTIWGAVLEALGRPKEALNCWRSGYQMLSGYAS